MEDKPTKAQELWFTVFMMHICIYAGIGTLAQIAPDPASSCVLNFLAWLWDMEITIIFGGFSLVCIAAIPVFILAVLIKLNS